MNAGTWIKMFDGSTKNVEDVRREDLLLEFNNTPSGVVVLIAQQRRSFE